MAGRRHRDELGQTLDDPKQQRPEQELKVHSLPSGSGGRGHVTENLLHKDDGLTPAAIRDPISVP
jgi:hypothetical protein